MGKKYKGKRVEKNPIQEPELIRLNRFIANAGVCSRREADTLIAEGKVTVNGKVVTELGTKISHKDRVEFSGKKLTSEKLVYVLLNKPKDYVSTVKDPQGRKTVMELVSKASTERIYPVGRLDKNTTGLLLFTNDGDLAKKLTHPSFEIKKLYWVGLDKDITDGDIVKLANGFDLDDGYIKADSVSRTDRGGKNEIGLELHSGRNRIVRRMLEHLGYKVIKLDRVLFANLTKRDLPRGRYRHLSQLEIGQLKQITSAK